MNFDLVVLKAWQDQQKTQIISFIKSFSVMAIYRCYSEQKNIKITLLFYRHREFDFSLTGP
jgi:hypothetical protein